MLGDWFGISQPVVSRIIAEIRPVIGHVCADDLGTLDQALRDGAVLIDGTVVPMWDWRHLGTSHFSGKHHTPGFNVQSAADLAGNLRAASSAVPGARHDSAAIELAGWDKILDEPQHREHVGKAGRRTSVRTWRVQPGA